MIFVLQILHILFTFWPSFYWEFTVWLSRLYCIYVYYLRLLVYGESIIDSLDETASSCCLIMTHLLDEAIFFGIVLKLIGWHLIYKSDNEWLFRKNNCLCPFWIFAGMILLFSPDNNVDNQDRDIFQFLVWYDVSNVTFLIQIVLGLKD